MRLGDLDDLKVHISELMLVYSGEELDNTILNAIDNAPTVELLIGRMVNGVIIPIKRPQGEWIVKSSGTTHYFMCSKCGSAGDIQDKYCRECGLKMKGGDEK